MSLCDRCGEPSTLRCGRCKVVKYCTRECQRLHYKQHKAHCHAPFTRKHKLSATQPRDADHSYNGIFFDVEVTSIDDIVLDGFNIGGELGSVSVWHRAEGSCIDNYKLEVEDGWSCLTQCILEPSHSARIQLDAPLLLPSGSQTGLYIHAVAEHDQALKYQSCSSRNPSARDNNIRLWAGHARIGSSPFDTGEVGGRRNWYRRERAFAGDVIYHSVRLKWSPIEHLRFPSEFRGVVFTLFLCWYRDSCIISMLPLETLFNILECLDWRHTPTLPNARRQLKSGWLK